jgi:hypothetical protein
LAGLFSPLNLLTLGVIGGGWYGYVWWVHGDELARQMSVEAGASLGFRPLAPVGHALFYVSVLAGLHVPAVPIATYAWFRRGTGLGRSAKAERDPALGPDAALGPHAGLGRGAWPGPYGLLAWTVLVFVVAATFLLLRHKERYLLIVTPAVVMLAGVLIHRAGLARPARVLALASALLQVTVFVAYPFLIGRPLNQLVHHWQQHLGGGLASALDERETSWVNALSGGRVTTDTSRAAYVLVEDTGALPRRDVLIEATERSHVWWEGGRLRTRLRTYALVRRQPGDAGLPDR